MSAAEVALTEAQLAALYAANAQHDGTGITVGPTNIGPAGTVAARIVGPVDVTVIVTPIGDQTQLESRI